MATRVHSYSKINLGLAIGPVREDGFHGLVTLYQTLELHDVVTVTARRADAIKIEITTNHPWVPRDARNTAWKMVERGLERLMVAAEVSIHIEKNLPVQGGLGAGSANAAAALIGLEKELGVEFGEQARMEVAAAVGSDVPLFLVGGAVLGTGRGEIVEAMPELPKVVCVVAVPEIGVSTPAAFKAWDSKQLDGEVEGLVSAGPGVEEAGAVTGVGLTSHPRPDRLKELSQAYASAFGLPREISGQLEPDPSGIIPAYGSAEAGSNPEKKQGVSDERQRGLENNLAENILLTLVRTGVENDLRNDFEEVVFPEYPSLRETKRLLMGIETGQAALYAALSGSGSALFGLYRSIADAEAAQQRVQATGVKALITNTLPRAEYWARMFAG